MIRKKIKVAAYARVSTDKDDQLNSLDNQRIYFQNYIKGHPDWEFVDVYWDEGISGTQTSANNGSGTEPTGPTLELEDPFQRIPGFGFTLFYLSKRS